MKKHGKELGLILTEDDAAAFEKTYADFEKNATVTEDEQQRILSSVMKKAGFEMNGNITVTNEKRRKIGKKAATIIGVFVAAAAMTISATAYVIRTNMEIYADYAAGGDTSEFAEQLEASVKEAENDDIKLTINGLAADNTDCRMLVSVEAKTGKGRDIIHDLQNPDFSFRTNHDGGIQAGITNGQEIYFRVAFKPIPSVRYDRETVDFEGNPAVMHGSDRNDLCVAPRVLPVVEAMAAMVAMDFWQLGVRS